MSTTATQLPVSPSAPSPEEPDRRVIGVLETDELRGVHGTTEVLIGVAASFAVSQGHAYSPLVFHVDPERVCIVQDVTGAVYGAGATFEEARAEFETALDDHLRFLRGHRDELDERLQRQLPVLERLFPGR